MTNVPSRKARLTPLQRTLLGSAAEKSDHILPAPDGVRAKGATLHRCLSRLLARGLVEEVAAGCAAQAWREPEADHPTALRLTAAGRAALGLDAAGDADAPGTSTGSEDRPALPRAGTKQAQLAGMLAAPDGATLEALASALGWLPHTTRAAITGLRKRGLAVSVSKAADGRRVYRIEMGAAHGAAA